MARKPRFTLAGYSRHIIQCGQDRQTCFFGSILSCCRKRLTNIIATYTSYLIPFFLDQ